MEFPASVMLEITQSCLPDVFFKNRWIPSPSYDAGYLLPIQRFCAVNGYGETSIVPGLACLDHRHYSESREIITNFSFNNAVYLDLHARGFTQFVSWDAASQAASRDRPVAWATSTGVNR